MTDTLDAEMAALFATPPAPTDLQAALDSGHPVAIEQAENERWDRREELRQRHIRAGRGIPRSLVDWSLLFPPACPSCHWRYECRCEKET